ncbi:MFS transporter [Falsirhodobacter algicola]|uniref:MFS transporter n=1 Tax=Falsirhodobacter algicola TaxID=2692330 RepID=A0A8J8MSQ5_9RHOB|nr:MFS transporter [Falsirhodobacter algicola]QUS35784.1 MFS transporter [Falsirhodobacter algicola]
MRHASLRAMTVYGTLTAVVFALGASVPTPLYPLYQRVYGLVPFQVTALFAIYVVALLIALLTAGRLSNHLGRKPVIAGALLLNLAALAIFLAADSYQGLLLARVVQGLAMGIAVPTCGAAIVDADPERGPVLNSVVPFLGMSFGALSTGLLVSLAPHPMALPYVAIGIFSVLSLLALVRMPETCPRHPGALASLRPSLGVPRAARAQFIRYLPPVLTGWAIGGLYMSLMPTLLNRALHTESQMVTGVIVCVLMGSAAVAVMVGRTRPASRMMLAGAVAQMLGIPLTLAGMELGQGPLMFLGTMIVGTGQGLVFSSILRLLLPLAEGQERASMLATFFALSYTAFAAPAVLAGMAVPYLGLMQTAFVYGMVILVALALALLGLRRVPEPKRC